MKILRYILSITAIAIAVYGLITINYEYSPLMILILSLVMLVMGLEEFRKDKKSSGWLLIVVFLFSLFVSIQGFFLR